MSTNDCHGSSCLSPDPHEHRLRNLLCIQVRNFTPFPVRDEVTSTLSQAYAIPSDSVDDIEIMLNRRRSRRISTNSLGSVPSSKPNLEAAQTNLEQSPGRARANLRTTRRSHAASQSRSQRGRALSSASIEFASRYATVQHSTLADDVSPPTSPIGASTLGDQIQSSLERVIASRLVETFLSLEPWSPEEHTKSHPSITGQVIDVKSEASSSHIRSVSISSRMAPPHSPIFQEPNASPEGHSLHKSSRSSSPARPQSPKSRQALPPTGHTTSPRTKALDLRSIPISHSLPTPAPSPPPERDAIHVPFYISSFHPPSTNPTFASLDVWSDFAPWADLSSHCFRAALWGRAGQWGKTVETKGKERELVPSAGSDLQHDSRDGEWELLASWEVDMDGLKPLPTQLTGLPSNTLVLRLSPDGNLYYLPGGTTGPSTGSETREDSLPPSPNAGYSDTEVDSRTLKGRRRSERILPTRVMVQSMRETKMKKSAGFGDLLKLVNLQSALADTKVQLDEIISTCDHLLENNAISSLNREIAQKAESLHRMSEDRQTMTTRKDRLMLKLMERRTALQRRRKMLDDARIVQEDAKHTLEEFKGKVEEERRRYKDLLNTLMPVRTTLLQTVATIFPIEPIEPKDLLFGIVDLPLPIPLAANDPAPPLSIPRSASYNDETLASALGYVAQVVSLVTAYLGDFPTYPVVCQGSRSLIKDPISAMMGPRMFPLYTKGVDTYRFEYGVFLLNKNIELLMSERDLRALDMRHTLPNLKNLLLTLTSGETTILKSRPRKKVPALSASTSLITDMSSLASGPPTPRDRPSSPLNSEQESEGHGSQIQPMLPTTPTASKIVIEPDEPEHPAITATSSLGSTEIPPSANTGRKSFYSLATFLRARYPSVRTPSTSSTNSELLNIKVEVEPPSDASVAPIIGGVAKADDAGDADETSTIKGSVRSKFALFHREGERQSG